MSMHYLPGPQQLRRMTTDEIRDAFLITGLFQPGAITLRAVDLDRVILGGAVPGAEPLRLEPGPELDTATFLERREVGILNTGGAGTVTVDGETYELARLDLLYAGRGAAEVTFASADASNPARFYLVSYPAHASHPTRLVKADEAQGGDLGTLAQANQRRLSKYVHPDAFPSAQLVMGVTQLKEGSVWNTMPAHTHQRRTEVYLYFGLPQDGVVFHFLGEPGESRSVVVRDGDVVLSPSWSIHSGCGTGAYTFCWAMGGENQAFADMQGVAMADLR
ncbi:5-dehydro-4-deoxy-D-glucuronate isomerase [Longimicrobium terrae]|uniref:4-deoxy-L-threo-5-hexosulose-uronate ketol-isomerase n=1 Tax=Longimicrobium terrae TaxID=1639882 RepID=A0A841H3U4_9BACT|nr:5-dehydro-4-deoxy-D-glucuronate isomerase [Longimicrobium terrae]MBB4638509.1 4-deoxy-L-threo-5-hexosulose-uronate ketol-isomerase [Longimicrobium terrae]MBB6072648.1 4-deoxy-L-threo-5-hexosulose-uronate ketol-isomerase [Longimicrobium terrae]NNC32476.1 5-dehydro-4-deoxy-D-glucuronate isomerase [Longimicrobium terrae]